MRHYKTVVVPAKRETTQEEIEKITCDLCKGLNLMGANYIQWGGIGEHRI